jgi:hypothetical protein
MVAVSQKLAANGLRLDEERVLSTKVHPKHEAPPFAKPPLGAAFTYLLPISSASPIRRPSVPRM